MASNESSTCHAAHHTPSQSDPACQDTRYPTRTTEQPSRQRAIFMLVHGARRGAFVRTRQAAAAASELWVGVLRASLGGRIERSTLYAEASFSIRPQTFECVLSSARRVWPIAKPEEVETWPRTLLAPASLLGSLRAVGAGQVPVSCARAGAHLVRAALGTQTLLRWTAAYARRGPWPLGSASYP